MPSAKLKLRFYKFKTQNWWVVAGAVGSGDWSQGVSLRRAPPEYVVSSYSLTASAKWNVI